MTRRATPLEAPVREGVKVPVQEPVSAQAAEPATFRGEGAGRRASAPVTPGSRLLKGAHPLQSGPRPSAVGQRYSLAHRLTDRDHAIVAAVHRHRVFTTAQLAAVFFPSLHAAVVRLRTLTRLGVLDRFRAPARRGLPNEYHYVLGRMGAAMAAAERGDDPDRAARRWRGEAALALSRGQRLAHAVGVSGFYAGLAAESRVPGRRLVEWLTEADTARWSEGIVRPDGLGVWEEDGRRVEFLLEYDRGTETLARLAAKLAGYARFEAERGGAAWVLFAFTSARREGTARRALSGADVAVATAVVPTGGHPNGDLWLPLGRDAGRVRLAELADEPMPEAALARAAQGSLRAWRFARSRTDDEEEAPIEST